MQTTNSKPKGKYPLKQYQINMADDRNPDDSNSLTKKILFIISSSLSRSIYIGIGFNYVLDISWESFGKDLL